MRAAVYKETGAPLVIEELPDPTPLSGEIVIKVHRCGICGTDVHNTSGHGSDWPLQTVPGHEYAGEIVAIGSGVEGLREGDRISAMPASGCGRCVYCATGYPIACEQLQGYLGGFGEYLRVAASGAFKLPQTLTMADGALVEPLAVGLHAVDLAEFQSGARVVILGGGSVGLATLFWARQRGAGRIVVVSRSARRADLALALGADAFEALGEGEADRIGAALGGPPDVVFECVGAVGMLGKSIELVRPGGQVVSLGFCTSPDPIIPSMTTWKRVTLKFSMAWKLTNFLHAADVLDRGHVEPRLMISETVSLDAFPGILEDIRNGSPQTKVHVDPWKA